jgi:hypothetical protein
MELTETHEKIETAIRSLCLKDPSIATAGDIADFTSLSKRTVQNNADDVVRHRDDIDMTSIGQANVYFIVDNETDEIWNDETESIVRLDTNSKAAYAELRKAPTDSDFDFIVHWYDYGLDEIEHYIPTPSEIGLATGGYGSEPVSIKFYQESDLDAEFTRVDDISELYD